MLASGIPLVESLPAATSVSPFALSSPVQFHQAISGQLGLTTLTLTSDDLVSLYSKYISRRLQLFPVAAVAAQPPEQNRAYGFHGPTVSMLFD